MFRPSTDRETAEMARILAEAENKDPEIKKILDRISENIDRVVKDTMLVYEKLGLIEEWSKEEKEEVTIFVASITLNSIENIINGTNILNKNENIPLHAALVAATLSIYDINFLRLFTIGMRQFDDWLEVYNAYKSQKGEKK